MSLTKLFSRRVLCLGLGSDGFSAVVRDGKQFVSSTAYEQAVNNPEQAWQVVLSELQTWLRQAGSSYQGLPLRITLASRWCQMQSLPWSDALMSPASRAQFLQNQFVALFGDAARDWVIQADDAPYGQPRVACAIERELFDGLQQLAGGARDGGSAKPAASLNPALQAVESILSLGVRALLARAGSREACAIIEPGRFSLILLQKNRIIGMHSQSYAGHWERELPASWLRWTLRQPELAQIKQVAVLNLAGTRSGAEGKIELAAPFENVLLPSFNLPPNLAVLACDRGE